MEKLSLVIYPNSILRTPAKRVRDFNNTLVEDVEAMKRVVQKEKGLGLAANQVGFTQQIIVFSRQESPTQISDYEALINPKIISHSQEIELAAEGCLSLPKIEVEVPRYNKVTILGQNLDGARVKVKAKNLLARVLQHEIDHLRAKLIIDYGKEKVTFSKRL